MPHKDEPKNNSGLSGVQLNPETQSLILSMCNEMGELEHCARQIVTGWASHKKLVAQAEHGVDENVHANTNICVIPTQISAEGHAVHGTNRHELRVFLITPAKGDQKWVVDFMGFPIGRRNLGTFNPLKDRRDGETKHWELSNSLLMECHSADNRDLVKSIADMLHATLLAHQDLVKTMGLNPTMPAPATTGTKSPASDVEAGAKHRKNPGDGVSTPDPQLAEGAAQDVLKRFQLAKETNTPGPKESATRKGTDKAPRASSEAENPDRTKVSRVRKPKAPGL